MRGLLPRRRHIRSLPPLFCTHVISPPSFKSLVLGSRSEEDAFILQTCSDDVVNDILLQFSAPLPFGGVGNSGIDTVTEMGETNKKDAETGEASTIFRRRRRK